MGFEWRIFFPISKDIYNAAATKHEPSLQLSSQTDYLQHVHHSKSSHSLSGCEQRTDQYFVLRNINLGLKLRSADESLPKSTAALVPNSFLELKVRSAKDTTSSFKKWSKVIATSVKQKTIQEELAYLKSKGCHEAEWCIADFAEQSKSPVIAAVAKRRWKRSSSEQTDMMIHIVEDESSKQNENSSQQEATSHITGPFYYRSVCVEGSYGSVESDIQSERFVNYLKHLEQVFSSFQVAEGEKVFIDLTPMDYPEFLLKLSLFHGVKV